MNHFCVLGRIPSLGLAEFEAVLPKSNAILIDRAVLVENQNWDGAALMDTLGGTVKLGDVIANIPKNELDAEHLADFIEALPRADRVLFGLTTFGIKFPRADRLAKDLKRELKSRGRSVRWVTSDGDQPPSPAAVAKLKLTTEGYDLVLVEHDDTIAVGFTTHVQNANAWSHRDYDRPARSSSKGMLPPKLARIMVNLADVPKDGTLLDPFCGSGTVLMETALATEAAKIIGTDLDPEQVEDAEENLKWLYQEGILNFDSRPSDTFKIFASDVRNLNENNIGTVDAVVTEGHLGPPLKGNESREVLEQNADEITSLWKEALPALHSLLKKGGRIVCVWPSFKTKGRDVSVDLSEDPFVQKHFSILNTKPLSYTRPNQHVVRKIYILEKR